MEDFLAGLMRGAAGEAGVGEHLREFGFGERDDAGDLDGGVADGADAAERGGKGDGVAGVVADGVELGGELAGFHAVRC